MEKKRKILSLVLPLKDTENDYSLTASEVDRLYSQAELEGRSVRVYSAMLLKEGIKDKETALRKASDV